ncbi:TraR/DksA C4-type zinc finger protein [Streptomyces sp. NPDC051577]|uniref:TraR/DksA family transcriptional regulator n=1 Tax=Streptomyces sp. NPDC051577 TaxID=3155166 RepID=UPI003422DAC2
MVDASRHGHDEGDPAPFAADRARLAADRARLAADRADTLARTAALRRDFDAIVAANALVAVDDEHDPEGASTAFERAHVAALIARAHEHLAELDEALERLERGEYGQCERCGQTIPPERLEIRPAATTCVRCAQPDRRRPPRPA